MAYGDLKVNNLIYDTGSGDVTLAASAIPLAASPAFTGTITGVNLTLSGDLTVNGTTTTIDTTTLDVEDKNITLGKVSSPSDTTADGGGITLKGATDKTIIWLDATDSWTFSDPVAIPSKATTYEGLELITPSGDGSGEFHIGVHQSGSSAGRAIVFSRGGTDGMDTESMRIDSSGNITGAGSVSDSKGNVRSIPQNTQGSAYELLAADAGKHILASGNITWVDSRHAAGDAITIVNNTGGNITITKGTTMYNAADGNNANRTLATRGVCTILWVSGTVAYISGAGLS